MQMFDRRGTLKMGACMLLAVLLLVMGSAVRYLIPLPPPKPYAYPAERVEILVFLTKTQGVTVEQWIRYPALAEFPSPPLAAAARAPQIKAGAGSQFANTGTHDFRIFSVDGALLPMARGAVDAPQQEGLVSYTNGDQQILAPGKGAIFDHGALVFRLRTTNLMSPLADDTAAMPLVIRIPGISELGPKTMSITVVQPNGVASYQATPEGFRPSTRFLAELTDGPTPIAIGAGVHAQFPECGTPCDLRTELPRRFYSTLEVDPAVQSRISALVIETSSTFGIE